jgi:hypothetical protein
MRNWFRRTAAETEIRKGKVIDVLDRGPDLYIKYAERDSSVWGSAVRKSNMTTEAVRILKEAHRERITVELMAGEPTCVQIGRWPCRRKVLDLI